MADSILALADALDPLAEVIQNDSTMVSVLSGFLTPINTESALLPAFLPPPSLTFPRSSPRSLAVAVGGVASVVPGVLLQLNSM